MNALRGLLRDLVDRKLWPVAVLLLVAALAVPLYLGRSSDAADTPLPVPAGQDAAKTSKAAVTLEDTAADDARPGGVHNPFKQLHVPKATDTKTAKPAPSADTPSSSGGSGGDGSVPPLGSGGSGGSGARAPRRPSRPVTRSTPTT